MGTLILALVTCAGFIAGCGAYQKQRPINQVRAAAAAATPGATTTTPESGPVLVSDQPSGEDPSTMLTQPEIYRGGAIPVRAEPPQGVTDIGGADITFNFANADVREVVGAILGDALHLTYIIDPRVQGTITLRSAAPLPRSAAVGMLEDVLAMNGAALVREDELYKIVPIAEAVSAPAILRQGAASVTLDRGFSLHVFPVRYASAAALMDVIQPLAPPGRQLRVDPERNLFILAATSSEADDFSEMLSLFDVDWMRDQSFGLFPLKHADPENVAAELRRVFAQPEDPAQTGIIEFLPIQRLNAILVITPQEAYIDQAQSWIQRLDRGMEADRRQLYVYFVQNGRAKELAEIVGEALSADVAQTDAGSEARLGPGLLPGEISSPAGASVLGGSQSYGSSNQPIGSNQSEGQSPADVYDFDEPPQSTGFLTDRQTASAGPDIDISGDPEQQQQFGSFRIVADPRNNALLVYATSTEFELVSAALTKLDIVPLQVFIEATIAEVTLNDTLKYGLEWFFDVGNSTITFNTTGVTTSQPKPNNLIFTQAPGFSYLFATSDIRVVLNALTQITDVNVISSPTLLVLDNEPARLQVGDQVPISVRSSTSVTDSDAPVVNEIEYRDTGVILDLVPRVNSSGLVVLDIIQEVSDVASSTFTGATVTQTISPTISQRRIASTVAVKSGETIALGGLIRDSKTNAVTGVPLLSDIPVLGNLFKTTTDFQRRTELLVLLTPRIVRDSVDARTVTDELRRRLRAVEPLPALIQ
jgi:general secretion pathway protein D